MVKKASGDLMANARVIANLIGLTNFIFTVIGRNLTSCQISKTYLRGRGLLRDNCPAI